MKLTYCSPSLYALIARGLMCYSTRFSRSMHACIVKDKQWVKGVPLVSDMYARAIFCFTRSASLLHQQQSRKPMHLFLPPQILWQTIFLSLCRWTTPQKWPRTMSLNQYLNSKSSQLSSLHLDQAYSLETVLTIARRCRESPNHYCRWPNIDWHTRQLRSSHKPCTQRHDRACYSTTGR